MGYKYCVFSNIKKDLKTFTFSAFFFCILSDFKPSKTYVKMYSEDFKSVLQMVKTNSC